MNIEQIKFGHTYKDKVTGFKGYCTAKALYATGCNQIALQPATKKGSFQEAHWFDIERVESAKGNPIDITTSPTGGDRGADQAPIR
ncbi:hypothetical protein [Maritalea sp.]|uniref:hypothetical protein n=1 Tax=Maritalea sp. TaxID=2003361 RepID=UPI003EF8B241